MLILMEPKMLQLSNTIYEGLFPRENTFIYSINCVVQGYPRIDLLPKISSNGIPDTGSDQFDQFIINTIMGEDYYFSQFMIIVSALAQGCDVILLYWNENFIMNPVTEIVCKIIQQRYGYNYIQIDSLEQIEFIFMQLYPEPMFTAPGIQLYDADFRRYQEILIKRDPSGFVNTFCQGGD